MIKKNKQGFSFIELIVVIAIIGTLATLVVISINGSRAHARDVQRVSNMYQIQTALDLYFNRYKIYPTAITPGQALAVNGTIYLDPVPSNPTPRNDGSCSSNDYAYTIGAGNLSYSILFCLGSGTGSLIAGNNACTESKCSTSADPDVLAYTNRVTTDGGTIVDATALQNAVAQSKTDGWFTSGGSMVWVASDFGVKTSGGLVLKLYDIFGNDITFPSGFRPAYNASGGPNSTPRITWSSGNYGTFASSLAMATTQDIFDVMKQTSNSSYKMLYGETNSNSWVTVQSATNFVYAAHGVGSSGVTVTSILNLNKIINFNRNGTTAIHLNINNVAQADATLSSNQNFVADEYGSYSGGALTFVGDRMESIISKNYLNAYRSLIMTYLDTKYAIY